MIELLNLMNAVTEANKAQDNKSRVWRHISSERIKDFVRWYFHECMPNEKWKEFSESMHHKSFPKKPYPYWASGLKETGRGLGVEIYFNMFGRQYSHTFIISREEVRAFNETYHPAVNMRQVFEFLYPQRS